MNAFLPAKAGPAEGVGDPEGGSQPELSLPLVKVEVSAPKIWGGAAESRTGSKGWRAHPAVYTWA